MKNHTNAICPLCWGLTYTEEKEDLCGFCNSELCAHSFYEPLDSFLEDHTLEVLEAQRQQQKDKIKATHWWKDRRHRFYLKDFLRSIEKVINLKKESLKKYRWILLYNDTFSGESYRLPKQYKTEAEAKRAAGKENQSIQKKNPDSKDWVTWQQIIKG